MATIFANFFFINLSDFVVELWQVVLDKVGLSKISLITRFTLACIIDFFVAKKLKLAWRLL